MGTPAAAANYLASRELVTPRRLREILRNGKAPPR